MFTPPPGHDKTLVCFVVFGFETQNAGAENLRSTFTDSDPDENDSGVLFLNF